VQAFFAPAHSESAAPPSTSVFALNYHANTTITIRTELGARFNRSVALDDGATLALRGRAAWAHDFNTGPNVVAEFQAMPGAPFTVQGAAPGHDSLLLTAGAEVGFTNGFSVAGTFDSELALGSQTYAGTGRVSYRW
jgi:outer membrane autotransporter protein